MGLKNKKIRCTEFGKRLAIKDIVRDEPRRCGCLRCPTNRGLLHRRGLDGEPLHHELGEVVLDLFRQVREYSPHSADVSLPGEPSQAEDGLLRCPRRQILLLHAVAGEPSRGAAAQRREEAHPETPGVHAPAPRPDDEDRPFFCLQEEGEKGAEEKAEKLGETAHLGLLVSFLPPGR